jgi:hypothetical protein
MRIEMGAEDEHWRRERRVHDGGASALPWPLQSFLA